MSEATKPKRLFVRNGMLHFAYSIERSDWTKEALVTRIWRGWKSKSVALAIAPDLFDIKELHDYQEEYMQGNNVKSFTLLFVKLGHAEYNYVGTEESPV